MTDVPTAPTPDELVRLVTENPLLSSIKQQHLEGLKSVLEWVPLAAGEELFHEGDSVDAFYFVIDGLLEVTTLQEDLDGNKDNDLLVLARVQPGETIGEMQILTGGARTATVTARQDSHLVKFSKRGFDAFLKTDPDVVRKLEATIMPRLYRDQMVDVLPKLFGELDESMLRDLENKIEWRHKRRGEVLFEQGAPSDSFFVIISGRLQVLIRDKQGRQQMVGELSQGESVGEMGVFTGEERSATIVASRDSELIEFSQEEFEELTEKYPQLLRHMTRLLINRLQRAYREAPISNLSSNIMLAPASGGVALDDFAQRLHQALGAMGECLLLTSSRVDQLMELPGISHQSDEGEPDDLRLRSWLNEQEKHYRFILYQSDPTVTGWTRRCIRQADRILSVGSRDGDARLSEVEGEVLAQQVEQGSIKSWTLVLLHPDGRRRPSGTLAWLHARRREIKSQDNRGNEKVDVLELDRHLHVRLDRDGDFGRVARFMAGHAVGVVLSGGGARGFAHVGILKAIEEVEVPVDMIAGVSMGAGLSALYAYSEDFQAAVPGFKAQLKGLLNDYTLPIVSLARGTRLNKRMQAIFGDVNIEDLWTPYFCVTSNLTKGSIRVHRTGPLWRAVRASGSLPGIVTPVIYNGDMHFDGCLLNNLPMDVMRDQVGGGLVIAIDVVPPEDLKMKVVEVESPSGWGLLGRKVNPFQPTLNWPSIFSILQRAGELGTVYGRQKLIEQNLADIYIEPQVQDFAILDFSTVDATAKQGYVDGKKALLEDEAGRKALDEWRATQQAASA